MSHARVGLAIFIPKLGTNSPKWIEPTRCHGGSVPKHVYSSIIHSVVEMNRSRRVKQAVPVPKNFQRVQSHPEDVLDAPKTILRKYFELEDHPQQLFGVYWTTTCSWMNEALEDLKEGDRILWQNLSPPVKASNPFSDVCQACRFGNPKIIPL